MTDRFIDVLFDAPPGPESGRFIECENEKGEGINAGEWIPPNPSGDGYWRLRLKVYPSPSRTFAEVQKMCYDIAKDHGFHDVEKTPLEEIALWHSEASEACEEARVPGQPLDRVWYQVKATEMQMANASFRSQEVLSKIKSAQMMIDLDGEDAEVAALLPSDDDWRHLVEEGLAKPEGYGIEAADLIIRVFDAMEAKGIPIYDLIMLKSSYNRTREHMHGKTV